jgi:nucleoside-diphosphate-sugar epimerase
MTKKAMEEIAPENSIGLRFFTVFGPSSRGDMFFDMLLKDRIKYVTDHQRDWTHVDDVTDGIILLMEKGEDITGCVDVGCGSPCSVEEVVEKYGKGPYPVKEVTGEATYTCANPCVLESLGWKPKHHILTENIEQYE